MAVITDNHGLHILGSDRLAVMLYCYSAHTYIAPTYVPSPQAQVYIRGMVHPLVVVYSGVTSTPPIPSAHDRGILYTYTI